MTRNAQHKVVHEEVVGKRGDKSIVFVARVRYARSRGGYLAEGYVEEESRHGEIVYRTREMFAAPGTDRLIREAGRFNAKTLAKLAKEVEGDVPKMKAACLRQLEIEPAASDDKARGVYRKYEVKRTDGSSEGDGKHARCRYFVLDLDHDKHAAAALGAYAESCKVELPELAHDLSYTAEQLENHYAQERGGIDLGVDLGWKREHFWGEDEWGRRGDATPGGGQ